MPSGTTWLHFMWTNNRRVSGSSGIYRFSHLPPRFQEFQITIEGEVDSGNKTILNQRSVRLGELLN